MQTLSCLTLKVSHRSRPVSQYTVYFISYYMIIFLVYFQTLLNERNEPIYLASILPAYCMLVAMAIWALILAGCSLQGLKSFCNPRISRSSYAMWFFCVSIHSDVRCLSYSCVQFDCISVLVLQGLYFTNFTILQKFVKKYFSNLAA